MVCNVPAIITGEVLAAYLSAFGQVDEYNLLRSPAGTAYGDYAFRLFLTKDGFKAIPETLVCGDRQMLVMVEGRRPRCWVCKQIGHITKFCPQRPENKEKASVTKTTTTKDAAATTTTINKEAEAQSPGQVQPKNNQEGWTEVTRKRRGSPKKRGKKSILIPSSKTNKGPTSTSNTRTTSNSDTGTSNSETSSITDNINSHPKDTSRSSTSSIPQKEQKENQTKPNRRDGNQCELEEVKGQWGRGRQKNMPWATQGRPLLSVTKATTSSTFTSASTTFPPSNLTTHTNPSPNCHPLTQQEQFFKKCRRPYQIPLPRSQSADRSQPLNLTRTPSLPSLSPSAISTQELFPAKQRHDPPASKKTNRQEGKELSIQQIQQAAALCSVELEAVSDFQLRKALKPLLSLEKIQNLNISNPANFRSAAMVTTFVRSAGDRTKGVWKFLSTVCQTDMGIKLAELEHSSLKKCIPFCSGRVPILVHASLYRSLKLRFPIDVGGITRDNQVTTELGTGSLRQAVGILTPKDFRPVVDTE